MARIQKNDWLPQAQEFALEYRATVTKGDYIDCADVSDYVGEKLVALGFSVIRVDGDVDIEDADVEGGIHREKEEPHVWLLVHGVRFDPKKFLLEKFHPLPKGLRYYPRYYRVSKTQCTRIGMES